MHPLRKLPLHMLLLAGLAVPSSAAEPTLEPSAEVKVAPAPENLQAHAGINVLPLTPNFRESELRMDIPDGVGVVVGFIDPNGPAAGKLLEKDVLTRLDDQVLVNAEQFRTLIRNRKPGQVAKLVRLRGDAIDTVEITLAGRPASRPRTTTISPDSSPDFSGSMGAPRIVINGQEIDPSQMIGGGTITFGAGAPGGHACRAGEASPRAGTYNGHDRLAGVQGRMCARPRGVRHAWARRGRCGVRFHIRAQARRASAMGNRQASCRSAGPCLGSRGQHEHVGVCRRSP